jgi:hypothetical protein
MKTSASVAILALLTVIVLGGTSASRAAERRGSRMVEVEVLLPPDVVGRTVDFFASPNRGLTLIDARERRLLVPLDGRVRHVATVRAAKNVVTLAIPEALIGARVLVAGAARGEQRSAARSGSRASGIAVARLLPVVEPNTDIDAEDGPN